MTLHMLPAMRSPRFEKGSCAEPPASRATVTIVPDDMALVGIQNLLTMSICPTAEVKECLPSMGDGFCEGMLRALARQLIQNFTIILIARHGYAGSPRVAPPFTARALSLSRSFRLRLSASSISPIGLNSSTSSSKGSLPLAAAAMLKQLFEHHSFVTADPGHQLISYSPAPGLQP